MKINSIAPDENDFTEVLCSIALMPKILFYYGDLEKMGVESREKLEKSGVVERDYRRGRVRSVAIVGARKNTDYGKEVAYRAAYELAKRGIVVVSGLAYGIDSVAHRGALDAGGKTVAVLGTPIDRIYPSSHVGLAKEIVDRGGLVMSEYGVGAEIFPKTSFLERNRLIAGLSEAVLVVEAADRSGTLNTAMHALDQNKDLFAVPGDVRRESSVGCNRLIKNGARLFTDYRDILESMEIVEPRRKKVILGADREENLILKAIGAGCFKGEEIVKKTGMSVVIFNQKITMLEIKGQVRAMGMGQWVLS